MKKKASSSYKRYDLLSSDSDLNNTKTDNNKQRHTGRNSNKTSSSNRSGKLK